jgi:hypothetical protein
METPHNFEKESVSIEKADANDAEQILNYFTKHG